ncbi:MAG: hypothetical protein ACREA0_08865, partial [bacterium]
MKALAIATFMVVATVSVRAEAAHDGASSPCCAQATIGTYAGKSCNEPAIGSAGCIEDPAGTGTCVGGDLTPPLIDKLENADSPGELMNVIESCVPVDPVPGETPEDRLERQTNALARCAV